ncbi:MAG: ABC transporter permease [Planctomycetota bacterium]|nr:ABC transporter permease [Planctomycetota bacterium]
MTERARDIRMYLPVYVVVLAVYSLAGFLSPTFFTWNNNVNLFGRVAPLILAGLAQTFVVLTGGIDLSLGAMISATNVMAASLPYVGEPIHPVLWCLLPPLAGLAMGSANGLLVASGRFPPFIVTLATSYVYLGIALFFMDEPGGEISPGLTWVASGRVLGLPTTLILMLLSVFLAHVFLSRTGSGRSLYAVGASDTLATQSGIHCGRVRFLAYALSGLLSGLTGTYLSARMFAGDPLVGEPYVMNSIAVAVIGGSSLAGGRGGALGIIGGAYIFYLIDNILNLLSVGAFYQYVAKGMVLILALAFSTPDLLKRLGLSRGKGGTC